MKNTAPKREGDTLELKLRRREKMLKNPLIESFHLGCLGDKHRRFGRSQKLTPPENGILFDHFSQRLQ